MVERAGRYLIIQRAQGILAGGAWCFVGGGIDAGESQEKALIREFAEEVGGVILPVRKVWEYRRPDGGLRLHWWEARWVDGVLRANPAEVSQIRWLTPAQIEVLPDVLESNLLFLRGVAAEAGRTQKAATG